jgi:16S rRNA (guanine527-N7)-methyltransferase
MVRWQKKVNLVGPSTLANVWVRHFADSAQLVEWASPSLRWADLGSGAGFPGMVVGIFQKRAGGGVTHLIESDLRKAAFLREVSRETGARVVVHARRSELALDELDLDIVTSRAMASLQTLFHLSQAHVEKGAVALFLKGRDIVSELTDAAIPCSFRVESWPDRLRDGGNVVSIRLA